MVWLCFMSDSVFYRLADSLTDCIVLICSAASLFNKLTYYLLTYMLLLQETSI